MASDVERFVVVAEDPDILIGEIAVALGWGLDRTWTAARTCGWTHRAAKLRMQRRQALGYGQDVEALVGELVECARDLGLPKVTTTRFDEWSGRYRAQTVIRAAGTWVEAHRLAGLDLPPPGRGRKALPLDVHLAALRRCQMDVGFDHVSVREFDAWCGSERSGAIRRRVSWVEANEMARRMSVFCGNM